MRNLADNFVEEFAHLFKLCIFLVFLLVYLRATGGEVGATSALAPKIGPLGLVRNILWLILKYIELKVSVKKKCENGQGLCFVHVQNELSMISLVSPQKI